MQYVNQESTITKYVIFIQIFKNYKKNLYYTLIIFKPNLNDTE